MSYRLSVRQIQILVHVSLRGPIARLEAETALEAALGITGGPAVTSDLERLDELGLVACASGAAWAATLNGLELLGELRDAGVIR